MMTHSYSRLNSGMAKTHSLKVKQRITGSIIIFIWTLFPEVIKKILLKQFFIPKRYELSQDESKFLCTGRAFEVRVNGETIKCWQWGEGPAIVCVHGWGGSGVQFQGVVDQAIAAGYSLIVFDGPGHGLSPGKFCSYFQMTDVVRALLGKRDEFSIAGLIGHSFGAAAIINSLSKENIQLPAVLIAPALQLVRLLDKAFGHYGIPNRLYMQLIAKFEEKYNYSFIDDNPIKLLKNENMSFLIVHDPEDTVTPYKDSMHAVQQFSSLKLMTMKNLGHKNILRDDKVIKAALAFIGS
ncbi:MAG: alpha/beta hydrolase [Desulfobacula sp.]|nr:alpha/beta hydrolase [Desulfobacula sp.]